MCGDGTVDPPEQCDPPNGATCDNQCQAIPIACGNGIVQPGEECDPPNTGTCSANCQTLEFCGDGIRQLGEQCDDGNITSGDGCSLDCRRESAACSDFPCGQGKVKICHVPPGNQQNEHTLCISRSALSAHLRNHPDHCGPCDEEESHGCEGKGHHGGSHRDR